MNPLHILTEIVQWTPSNQRKYTVRNFLFLLIGTVLLMSGCADRPEVSPSAYGTILESLPDLKAAKEPFPFPMEGDKDHQNCKFNEIDFM